MHFHGLSAEQALASLKTSAAGLDAIEATRRLTEFGPNHVEEVARENLLLVFAREFTHFFAIILWIGAALAFFAEQFDPGQGMARLGIAIIGVIIVNGIFSFWQEYKAEQAVAALRQLLPQKAQALRDGVIAELLAADLVPGDIVLLEEGNFVPADCRLVEAFGPAREHRDGHRRIPAQGAQRRSEQRGFAAVCEERGAGRHLGGVRPGARRGVRHRHAYRVRPHRPPDADRWRGFFAAATREIARLSRIVAMLATGMGVALFFVGQAMGLPAWENALFAIGIIVANVPEGLLPTVTLSLAMATQRMAKRNALVRHLPAVEALGSTTTICSDKTGTLTQNLMSVQRLWLGGGFLDFADLAAAYTNNPRLTDDHRELFVNAALCHNLKIVDGKLLGDPMEVALAGMGRQVAGALGDHQRIDEIPFDTDRKRMSVLCSTPQGHMLYCKGAPETVLAACDFVQFDAGVVPLDPVAKTRLLAAQRQMAEAGLRVLAFAHCAVADGLPNEERGMILAGLVGLEDPPRAEVPDAIARCASAGIRIIMVTGDHPHTALAIARQIGLVKGEQPSVITGDQLRSISPAHLQLALDAKEIIFARVAAEQKMLIVQALQKKGEIVAVTGDGVNDAPALKTADIGIAMGISGTDVAKEAADLILLDDNFASIVAAIEEGRAVFDNIRKFLTYILSSNIPELVPYLAFVLFRIPLPLTIIQILAVDLGTDMLPALALGAEKPEPAVMSRPPRARDERLLSWGVVARAYLFLGVLEAAAAMAVFFFVLQAAGWHYGAMLDRADPLYLQATSACLATIVVMQMMNVILCRHPFRSSLSFGFFGNPYILLGLAAELGVILLILYTDTGNWLFGTAPVGSEVWLLALVGAVLMWLLEETRKAWWRRILARKA
jgi:sodium/potassium-transporting ATPase subunit alpha